MNEMITSKDNITIKLCRKLVASAKERKEQGMFLAEGARLCCDAAKAGIRITTLFATDEAQKKYRQQLDIISEAAEKTWEIAPSLAENLADTKATQGVFCLCHIPAAIPFEPHQNGRYLLIDHLQDPGNLGTIIRGAEAFGISGVVLSQGCPDLYSPKVLRSTMGSAFRQPVYTVENLPDTILKLQNQGVSTYAAALDHTAVTARQLSKEGGLAVVIGNEGNGVTDQVLKTCNAKVYIPMTSQIESLNAAAAATILMWEMSLA